MSFTNEELEYYHNKGLVPDLFYYQRTNKPWWIIWNERRDSLNDLIQERRRRETERIEREKEEKRKQEQMEEQVLRDVEEKLPDLLDDAFDKLFP